jgi:hypothetical protein
LRPVTFRSSATFGAASNAVDSVCGALW